LSQAGGVTGLPAAAVPVKVTAWRDEAAAGERLLPEETAIALTYDRATFAVMMATPADLRDFAFGFSLSEGIVGCIDDIVEFEAVILPAGIECRMSLAPARRAALQTRRRRIAGPAGCGLCGMDSLAEAIKAPAPVSSNLKLAAASIRALLQRMQAGQELNRQTRGVHAAACFHAGRGDMLIREDVGRHNAVDKMIGAASLRKWNGAECVAVMTSRVSIELIQKLAVFGCGILIAVSVPSARAVREAEAAGMTLVAVARDDGFEVFTHQDRIGGAAL
jgi:FdhD protein